MVLLEANLVTSTSSYSDHVPLVEGQQVVEQSDAERTRKQRRRVVRMFALILLAAGWAAGIAVGTTLGINSNRTSPSPLRERRFHAFANYLTPFPPTPHCFF